jgi:hypothetical protein
MRDGVWTCEAQHFTRIHELTTHKHNADSLSGISPYAKLCLGQGFTYHDTSLSVRFFKAVTGGAEAAQDEGTAWKQTSNKCVAAGEIGKTMLERANLTLQTSTPTSDETLGLLRVGGFTIRC